MYLVIICCDLSLELVYFFSSFQGLGGNFFHVNMFKGQMHACSALKVIHVSHMEHYLHLVIPQHYSF